MINDKIIDMEDLNKDQNNNSSSYAKKESYLNIYRKQINLILGIVGTIFLFTIIALLIQTFKPSEDPGTIVNDSNTNVNNDNNTIDQNDEPIVTNTPTTKIIYIKDQKEVWLYDVAKNDKELVVSVPQFSDKSELITAAAFKSDNEVTYSYCPGKKGCTVYTTNLDTKGRKTEQEFKNVNRISQLEWGGEHEYLALITEEEATTNFLVKSGTIITPFKTFTTADDTTGLASSIRFDSKGDKVIFHGQQLQILNLGKRNEERNKISLVDVYKINGVQIDEATNAYDPLFVSDDFFSYRRGQGIYIKQIGEGGENLVTPNAGNSIEISPDKTQYAFWNAIDEGIRNVTLRIYDIKQNFTRNILRGIILPKWVTNTKLLGIKSESCLSDDCLLYEFQTAELILVDINSQETIIVDRGVSFRNTKVRETINK